jgi:type II secretory pathway component PulM
MMERFNQLAPREQVVLVVGALLAVTVIFWSFVWSPLRDGTGELDASIAERSRQVVDLRRAANLNASSAPALTAGNSPTLLYLVDETARPLGLAASFTRTSPDGPDAINVTIRDARFDRLIGWLIDLEQNYGVSVSNTNFTRTGGPGIVSGQIRLDRS